MALGKTNAGGGGGTGGTLVVTAPVGVTVTATNETLGKIYTRVANWEGKATFKGLASGTWAINMTDGSQTTNPVQVVVNSDYTIELSFFSATINVTYPAGSTCTATDGTTTLTAPDASGTWAITVPNAGTWTITSIDGDKSKSVDVEITTDGQVASEELRYSIVLIPNDDYADIWTLGGGGTETITADSLKLVVSSDGQTSYAYTKETYDLTDFTTLEFNVSEINSTSSGNREAHVYVHTSQIKAYSNREINATAEFDLLSNNTTGTFSLDISALSGNFYIGAIVYDIYIPVTRAFDSMIIKK